MSVPRNRNSRSAKHATAIYRFEQYLSTEKVATKEVTMGHEKAVRKRAETLLREMYRRGTLKGLEKPIEV